ncbi:peptidoglycan recognition family protein [Kitasatospora sp. NPDC050543]|uniref:peptidoglycan recognition family protein n=1 Tax=Kitasatospora sp. NPDC050543 TaxID=3364054 RepID=UPI00378F8662
MSEIKPAVNRRTVMGAIGAAAAAVAVAPVSSAAARGLDAAGREAGAQQAAGRRAVSVPATRAESLAGADATVVRTDFPIRYVGVSWSGPKRGAEIRLHQEGGEPGDWQALPAGCAGGPDHAPVDAARNATALVAAAGAPGYDLRLPHGATDVRSAAIDTVHGPSREVSLPATASVMLGCIDYLPRAAWGADESKRIKNGVENAPPKYYPIQTLTVHHTDTPNADPDPAATVRAIYEYHAITMDWGDIGYHFLIDEAGRVYEGRWSDTDGIPAHDATGKVVTAFHTAGFNSGNLGIALLGTLVDQQPTEKARKSLTALLAGLTRWHGLDPQAHVTFVNPVNGVTKAVEMISGHRDWLATDCPGGTMYASLPALRGDVAALGAGER